MDSPGIVLIIILVVSVAGYLLNRRKESTTALRDEWGKPLDRWHDTEAIGEYHRWRAEEPDATSFMDDRTWSDLHLDLVFSRIDRTRSSIGQQLLYHRLRSTPTGPELVRFERLVRYFSTNEEARFDAQRLLSRLSHASGYRLWSICQKEGVPTHWWYGLFPLLTLTVLGSAIAIPVWPRALLLLLAILVLNVMLRVKLAFRMFSLLGPFKEIGPLLRCAKSVLCDPQVSKILGASRVEADLLSVRSLETTARWASRNSSSENELAAAAWEYLNLVFLVDANAVLFATRTLRRSGPNLLRIVEAVGEVDSAISTASLRAGLSDWTVPEFTEPGSPIVLTEAWHPLLEHAVPNSVVLNPGRGVIITGSNMSGKSTFLRTVGVTVVLAQTLNTCPCERYMSPRVRVRSAIGRSDDLTAGKSYYLVEVDAVLDLLRASESSDHHLFLFDELFRGTNTIERLAAGEAVLNALPLDAQGRGQHVVIAATHDGELVQMLEGTYDPHHFEETVQEHGLSFDFKIHPGPARTRSAIALLELQGAPADIVAQAKERVIQLDSKRAVQR